MTVVHERLSAYFRDADVGMSAWSNAWATAWQTVLDTLQMRIDYGVWNSVAESSAALWTAGVMVQPPGVDGNKRMAAGVMEAQLAKNGYRLGTGYEEIANMTLDLVSRQEQGIDREQVINETAIWIDDRMVVLDDDSF